MCEPISITAIALSSFAAVSSFTGQRQQAAQIESDNAAFEEVNRSEAISDALLSFRDINIRELEESIAASETTFDSSLEAQAAASTAAVAAGEAGVSGNSVDALLADFKAQQARRKDRINQNLGLNLAQLERQKQGIRANARSRINSFRQVRVNKPSVLAPLTQIGASVITGLDGLSDRRFRASQGEG